jgi:hypothetical protein
MTRVVFSDQSPTIHVFDINSDFENEPIISPSPKSNQNLTSILRKSTKTSKTSKTSKITIDTQKNNSDIEHVQDDHKISKKKTARIPRVLSQRQINHLKSLLGSLNLSSATGGWQNHQELCKENARLEHEKIICVEHPDNFLIFKGIQKLTENGVSVSIYDILSVIGKTEMSVKEVTRIENLIIYQLGFQHRHKIPVTRNDKIIYMNEYTPQDFEQIKRFLVVYFSQ